MPGHQYVICRQSERFCHDIYSSYIEQLISWYLCIASHLHSVLKGYSWNIYTVPETFYFPSWTVSERWAHPEQMLSALWANGECRLNGIWWALMNDERTQNTIGSAKWTVNAQRILCEHKMNDSFGVPIELSLHCVLLVIKKK